MTPEREPIYVTFGRWLRLKRQAAGLTQEKLGMAVGLTRSAIAAIEAGNNRTTLHQVMALAHAVETPVRLAKAS